MTDDTPKNLINDINTQPPRPLKPIGGLSAAPTPRTIEHRFPVSSMEKTHRRPKASLILISLAAILFIVSIGIDLNDWRINRANQKQVTALNKKTPSGTAAIIIPSTVKPGLNLITCTG